LIDNDFEYLCDFYFLIIAYFFLQNGKINFLSILIVRLHKMRKIQDIWNNNDIRCGGFYELAIQVSDDNLHKWLTYLMNFIKKLAFFFQNFEINEGLNC